MKESTSDRHVVINSSTAVTVPSRSIAKKHVDRRLHMYANRKSRSSMSSVRLGHSYTPYHVMAESRPLYLLLRLMWSPLRLQRRYHAYPFLRSVSIVVYICMPNANEAAVCHWCDQDLPTHHMVAESRPPQLIAPASP